jgi:hypothetical protein
MSRRLQRALENSVWVFTLAFLLLSVWGVGREAYRLRRLVEAQATLGASLAQLEQHALVMERSLLGLAHADHPKVRYVGYDPDALYRMLKQAHRGASARLQAIESLMTQHLPPQMRTALLRLQAEWQQVDTVLGEYLAQGQPEAVSLTALRAFTFEGQGTLGDAVHDFRRAYQRELVAQWQRALGELIGYFALHLMSVGLLIGLLWRRWGAPARWMRAALQQPDKASTYAARLCDTVWGELYERLRFQERRLREVEQFMRDVAMGRTPAPITPTDAADPLARSSQWLLRRLEQTHAQQEKAG